MAGASSTTNTVGAGAAGTIDRCPCCRICRLAPGDDTERDRAADETSGPTQRDQAPHDHHGHEQMFRRRFWVCLALSVPVLVWSDTIQDWFSYDAPEFPGSALIVPVLATVVFVYGGLPFLTMAAWEIRGRSPAMMTLISLAITVAYVFSMATELWDLGDDFFWELVTLIDIMLLGHWMEMRSVRQASGALGALAELMPDTAEVVLADDTVETRALSELQPGDVVLVRPGASVPADGVVSEGASEVDESMITGESRLVEKSEGDEMIGGTVNGGDSSLRARVTATGEDSALAGIMRLVAEAEASRSSTQLLADRAAARLFYAAVGAAGVTALVWTAVGGSAQEIIGRVVTVLVIACPHALGLAIPLVIAITTQIAASHGTLIRRREAIDTARDLDVIAMDKTGTLTEGQIGVVAVETVDIDPDRALGIAAAIEGDSEHLIARALRTAAEAHGVELPRAHDFKIEKGRGVVARVDGRAAAVGGPRLLEQMRVRPAKALASFSEAAGTRGESVVFLVLDDAPVAAFALADVIREESPAAVRSLGDLGVEVVMLTGDSRDVARAVADELEITRYFAEVLPADKDLHVQELQEQGDMVGMVGDGVNDAPALTRADIGIAIGSGTDVAVQSADLVLVKSNPLDIVRIVRLSAASYRKQVQNIWWGAGYNIVMIPLAAGILAPIGFVMAPAVGAVLMSLSTIVVAINAQLLRRVELR